MRASFPGSPPSSSGLCRRARRGRPAELGHADVYLSRVPSRQNGWRTRRHARRLLRTSDAVRRSPPVRLHVAKACASSAYDPGCSPSSRASLPAAAPSSPRNGNAGMCVALLAIAISTERIAPAPPRSRRAQPRDLPADATVGHRSRRARLAYRSCRVTLPARLTRPTMPAILTIFEASLPGGRAEVAAELGRCVVRRRECHSDGMDRTRAAPNSGCAATASRTLSSSTPVARVITAPPLRARRKRAPCPRSRDLHRIPTYCSCSHRSTRTPSR